jgi:hypothetical protein
VLLHETLIGSKKDASIILLDTQNYEPKQTPFLCKLPSLGYFDTETENEVGVEGKRVR